jgi:uncharacterized membrane protein SpoIIM required for sporulation
MRSILRSFMIFIYGALTGVALFLLISVAAPELKSLILLLLKTKIEAQEKLVRNPSMAILLNNLIASLLCSYGGFLTTMAFLRLGEVSDPSLRVLRRLDRRLSQIRDDRLKFYLSLFIFPVFILFLNGAVLGFLFGFFLHSPAEYFARLNSHGITELPAIILSGSIGLKIGEAMLPRLNTDFEAELTEEVRRSLKDYILVVALLVVSAYLETM